MIITIDYTRLFRNRNKENLFQQPEQKPHLPPARVTTWTLELVTVMMVITTTEEIQLQQTRKIFWSLIQLFKKKNPKKQ